MGYPTRTGGGSLGVRPATPKAVPVSPIKSYVMTALLLVIVITSITQLLHIASRPTQLPSDPASAAALSATRVEFLNPMARSCNLYHAFVETMLPYLAVRLDALKTTPLASLRGRNGPPVLPVSMLSHRYRLTRRAACTAEFTRYGVLRSMYDGIGAAANTPFGAQFRITVPSASAGEFNGGASPRAVSGYATPKSILTPTPAAPRVDTYPGFSVHMVSSGWLLHDDTALTVYGPSDTCSPRYSKACAHASRQFSKAYRRHLSQLCRPWYADDVVPPGSFPIPGAPKVVILNRQPSRGRHMVGVDAAMRHFRAAGWNPVHITYAPNDVCSLWHVLKDADVLVSPHGFQLLLMLMLPAHASVLSLSPPDFPLLVYHSLAKMNGLGFGWLDARRPASRPRPVCTSPHVAVGASRADITCRSKLKAQDIELDAELLHRIGNTTQALLAAPSVEPRAAFVPSYAEESMGSKSALPFLANQDHDEGEDEAAEGDEYGRRATP